MLFTIARRTAHGARRTAEAFGKTAFAVIALIGGFYTLTFADKTSAQQLPQTSISRTADGGGFADFRKQQQARFLSHIDGALAAKTEDAITDNFAAVKQVGVNLQTGLGGRNANAGINVIGAFAESDNRAFGWQLRAYGGKDINSGTNTGIFYRQTNGELLFGANAFADYEKHDYGNFFRYSIGGELQHPAFALAANYYIPQTDNRRVNATVAAFSREGYDAQLRVSAPGYRALKAAADYYQFDGKGNTKAQSGFRYGVEVQPNADLRFGLYYDSESENFGGDIAYAWTFGEAQKRESNAAFAPDLFAAVSREYSQRIATVAAVGISLRISIVGIMTTAMTIPAMTTTIGMETMAAVTTTTRMTAAAVTMTTTTETPGMVVASRLASVEVTVEISPGLVITTFGRSRVLVTLPPESTQRPHVLTITTNRNFPSSDSRVITTPNALIAPIGFAFNFPAPSPPSHTYTITIVQGSEMTIGQPTTTTLTNRTTTTMAEVITETPMTMAAVSTTTTMTAAAITTTTRITTFSTMFITLTANSAMGGNDERGGNDKQPSFPRKRESKPLSFVYLRDSANGDLSPQMANRRVRKARS